MSAALGPRRERVSKLLMIQLWSHPCCSSGTPDTDEAMLTWTLDNKDSGRVNMEAMFMLVFRFPHDLTRVTGVTARVKRLRKGPTHF